MSETETIILRCQVPDAVGIMAAITNFLAERHLNIVESHDFADAHSKTFFVRVVFHAPVESELFEALQKDFVSLATSLGMTWSMRPTMQKVKSIVMCSKHDHCLNDLLYRHRRDRLGVEITGIVSNHESPQWLAERHDIEFHHVPVTQETKQEAEAKLLGICHDAGCELLILARYMQILSPEFASRWEGRCINIHHSFLPSFKGARPYEQAYDRGVKIIGATAHFVTSDLDEGPIISQDVMPVDHRKTAKQMAETGSDIEARVLAHAVRAFGEGRIFTNGTRTVVFD